MKKRRNLWMGLTLMLAFLIITFKFDSESITWFWSGQEMVPVVLGISALIFGALWFAESKKMQNDLAG